MENPFSRVKGLVGITTAYSARREMKKVKILCFGVLYTRPNLLLDLLWEAVHSGAVFRNLPRVSAAPENLL